MEYQELKNRHEGRTGVIVATGPSLHDTPPQLISPEHITIGLNGIFWYYGFEPDYWIAEDLHFIQQHVEDIQAYTVPMRVIPQQYRQIVDDKNVIYAPNEDNTSLNQRFGIDALVTGSTVTFSALQLAFHMGIRTVYLIGLDHRYTEPEGGWQPQMTADRDRDPDHFFARYWVDGKRWHEPRLDRMEAAYYVARRHFQQNGGKIVNLTPGTACTVFELADFALIQ